MPLLLSVLASLGGLVTFCGAVWIIVKSVFAQTNATKQNTNALNELSKKLEGLDIKVDNNTERIATLEGWRQNGR
jgi:hypothetical protein